MAWVASSLSPSRWYSCDPVERVLQEEATRVLAPVAVEIESRAPRGRVPVGEVEGTEARQVIAVGAEVVVDDVQQHGQAEAVGRVHQPAQIVGRAVAARRREGRDPVIAPVAVAGKIGHGHQLDGRHPERAQGAETLTRRREGAGRGEGADVQLVDDEVSQRPAGPVRVGPSIRGRCDHHRRTVDAIGLPARGRIRERPVAIQPVAVTRARRDVGPSSAEGAVTVPRQAPRRTGASVPLEDQVDPHRGWRPDPERRSSRAGDGAERRVPRPRVGAGRQPPAPASEADAGGGPAKSRATAPRGICTQEGRLPASYSTS